MAKHKASKGAAGDAALGFYFAKVCRYLHTPHTSDLLLIKMTNVTSVVRRTFQMT